MDRNILEKLTVTHLVKKFPAFYGTETFISVHKNLPVVPILSVMNPVHTFFFKTHFIIIILPSTSRSTQWWSPPYRIYVHFSKGEDYCD
jgi:hypothetical protein